MPEMSRYEIAITNYYMGAMIKRTTQLVPRGFPNRQADRQADRLGNWEKCLCRTISDLRLGNVFFLSNFFLAENRKDGEQAGSKKLSQSLTSDLRMSFSLRL